MASSPTAPATSAVAVAPTPKERAVKWSLVIGASVVLSIVTLALFVSQTGVGAIPLAILLAVAPAPFYVALALWIDRYEPEPRWALALTFLWGALVATLVAYILNSLGSAVVAGSLGKSAAEIYGGSISAPVVEEGAKAAALLLLYRWRRRFFNGPLDGVVYAMLVGLGFAMTENVLYYARGAADEGVAGALVTFVMRGILSPFAHPTFTAATGLGLGLAARARDKRTKTLAPVVGLAAAIGLHSLWNSSAKLGLVLLIPLFFLPAFAALIVMAIAAARREARIVRENLPSGTVPADELSRLYSVRARLADAVAAFRQGGFRALRARDDYVRSITETAWQRYRAQLAAGPASPTVSSVEADYGEKLRRFWTQLVSVEPKDTAPGPVMTPTVPAVVAATPPVSAPATSESKVCPDCAETVRAAAKMCRFCGYRFAGDAGA